MLFAWAQNVSSDETAVRPQCALHTPTRPYLLLLGEDGRSTCHFRVDTRSPDSSCGFIMLPPPCLFCISIVSFVLASAFCRTGLSERSTSHFLFVISALHITLPTIPKLTFVKHVYNLWTSLRIEVIRPLRSTVSR